MIEKSIRIDEKYSATFDKFVASSKGAIKVIDKNLEYDRYFYRCKESIEKTIAQVDNGEMEMISHDGFWKDFIK